MSGGQHPVHPDNSDRLSQRRRAGAEITQGLEAEIEACHTLSVGQRCLEAVFFLSLYVCGAMWVILTPDHPGFLVMGVIAMGVVLNSLGIFIHEGLHGVLAKTPAWNHFFSFLSGVPLLISARAYRATHRDHHLDFGRLRDFGTYRQHVDTRALIWLAYFAQLFFGSLLYVLLIPFIAWRTADPRTRLWIIGEYMLIFLIAALAVSGVGVEALLTFWLYPSLVLMALSNVRGLSSHALGDLDDVYLSSRTVETAPWIEFLFLHENYHLEHHLFPQIPSYHLKRVHQLVWSRLPRALYASSYFAFLGDFLKASLTLNLEPVGQVQPVATSSPIHS